MSSTSKKIFLIASVIVPFLIYSVVYYAHVFKNAPYKFAEFEYFTFAYGPGDSLVNKYDSRTGDYQFVNSHDSLVKVNVRLSKKDLKKLHEKASLLGFWDWPSDETGDSTVVHNGIHAPHYVTEFVYKRKSKKVDFEESFSGDPQLKVANEQMYKETRHILDSVARSQNKH
jgi:hypothetical protein